MAQQMTAAQHMLEEPEEDLDCPAMLIQHRNRLSRHVEKVRGDPQDAVGTRRRFPALSRAHPSSCSRSSSGSNFRKYFVPVTSDSFTFCRRFCAILASLPLLDHDSSQRPWRTSHAERHQDFWEAKVPGGKESGIAFDRLKPVLHQRQAEACPTPATG
jgi:hypothetical protein